MSRPTSSPHHSIAKIKSLFYSNNPTQCFALCSHLLSSSQNLHPLHISTLHFYTALLHEDIARSSPLPSTILRACEKALAHYHLAISAVQCPIPTEHRIERKKSEQSDTYNLDELLSPAPLAAPPVKQEEARKRVDSPFEDLFEDTHTEDTRTTHLPHTPEGEKLETLQPVAFQPHTPSALFPPRHQSLGETHLTHGISTWVLTLHQHIASVQAIVSRTKPSSPSSPRIKKVRFAVFEGSEETPDRETLFEVNKRKDAWKRKGGYGSRDVGRWRRERFDAGGVRRFCEEVVGGMGVGV